MIRNVQTDSLDTVKSDDYMAVVENAVANLSALQSLLIRLEAESYEEKQPSSSSVGHRTNSRDFSAAVGGFLHPLIELERKLSNVSMTANTNRQLQKHKQEQPYHPQQQQKQQQRQPYVPQQHKQPRQQTLYREDAVRSRYQEYAETKLSEEKMGDRDEPDSDMSWHSFSSPSHSILQPIPRMILVDLFHDDKKIVTKTLDCFIQLCSNESKDNDVRKNRHLIYEIGGHFMIVAVIKKYYPHEMIQQNGVAALHYLTAYDKIRNSLSKIDIVATILLPMRNFAHNGKIQQYGCGAINCLTWKNGPNSNRLVNIGGLNDICYAMKTYTNNYILQQFGTLVLVNIARWKPYRALVVQVGGRERLTKVIVDYTEMPHKKHTMNMNHNHHTGSANVDFDYKIYQKARRAVRLLLI